MIGLSTDGRKRREAAHPLCALAKEATTPQPTKTGIRTATPCVASKRSGDGAEMRTMSAAAPVKVDGFCGLCIARCGTIATVEDGRFTRLDPDPTHPTGQALCAKGRAAPEFVYSKARLTRPLRRTRPKGESDPGWVEISWDEALDTIAAAMRRLAATHGPQSVAFSQSSPSTTAIGDSAPFMRRLMNAFGTPNLVWALDLCGWGRGFATRYAFGVGSVATGSGGGAIQ